MGWGAGGVVDDGGKVNVGGGLAPGPITPDGKHSEHAEYDAHDSQGRSEQDSDIVMEVGVVWCGGGGSSTLRLSASLSSLSLSLDLFDACMNGCCGTLGRATPTSPTPPPLPPTPRSLPPFGHPHQAVCSIRCAS